MKVFIINTDCWDKNVTGSNIEICGNRLPTSPQHINADVVRDSGSMAKLCVSWSPPIFDNNSVIIAYMITISDINSYVNAVSC